MEEKLENRIISVAYGESSFWERYLVNKMARINPEVEKLLNEHKRIADQTHNIEMEDCPKIIIDNVRETTNSKKTKESSLIFDLYSFIFRRPAISTAILSLFVLALLSTFIIKRPEIHQQYSKKEIELADKQVKQSLALISGVFKKTSKTVEEEVLTDRVSKPIKESFNLVNDYLQGENNENYN